jgi:hypothetical protein
MNIAPVTAADLGAPSATATMQLPSTPAAPVLTPQQAAAQAIIDKQDYLAMLRTCLPTLTSEHLAGQFLMAEMTKAGDVQVKKRQFMKAARNIVGGLPPFTEVALQLIAGRAEK